MQLHDTHFHLDLMKNPEQVVELIENSKIYTIAVTNLPDLFGHTDQLVKQTKYLRAALGFHPELAAQHKHQIALFEKEIDATRYIGEIGLDNFNKSPADYTGQRRIFEHVIDLCGRSGGKILTVHSRRAEHDVISIIGPKFPGKVILHWYSGSLKELERAVDFGFYFSVNLAMTISENGRKIIERIPDSRLLLESDGPFVKNENRQCTPLDVRLVAQRINDLIGKRVERSRPINIDANFKSLVV